MTVKANSCLRRNWGGIPRLASAAAAAAAGLPHLRGRLAAPSGRTGWRRAALSLGGKARGPHAPDFIGGIIIVKRFNNGTAAVAAAEEETMAPNRPYLDLNRRRPDGLTLPLLLAAQSGRKNASGVVRGEEEVRFSARRRGGHFPIFSSRDSPSACALRSLGRFFCARDNSLKLMSFIPPPPPLSL